MDNKAIITLEHIKSDPKFAYELAQYLSENLPDFMNEVIERRVWKEAGELVKNYFKEPSDPKKDGMAMSLHRIGLGMSFFMFARAKGKTPIQALGDYAND